MLIECCNVDEQVFKIFCTFCKNLMMNDVSCICHICIKVNDYHIENDIFNENFPMQLLDRSIYIYIYIVDTSMNSMLIHFLLDFC